VKLDRFSAAIALAAALAMAAFIVSRISFFSDMPRPLADIYLDSSPGGLALSADGSALAYTVPHEEGSLVEMRRIATGEVRRLARAKGALRPFFSPDGRHLAFVDEGALRRVSLESFEVEQIESLEDVEEGSFREDGGLLAATSEGLFLLSPSGEAKEILEGRVRSPLALPGSEWVVFETSDQEESRIEVFSLSSGARRVILSRASLPRLSPSGHLLFLRGSAIWASPFDVQKAELHASPAPIVPGAEWFDVAANGTLAFRDTSGPRASIRLILNWDVELRSRVR
jgi:hypothetical protein